MNDLWRVLKDSDLMKTHLRILKSDLTNYFYSIIHQIPFKNNYSNNKNISESYSESSGNSKNNHLFSKKSSVKIAFVVTESGPSVSAGDYFTAMELGEGLKELGWEVVFLSKKGSENWYHLNEDIDVVISLLDVYNPKKIKSSNENLLKIAWARNWFDRWVLNPGFLDYDIIFASSNKAVEYIKSKTNTCPLLLPIATNSNRFNDSISPCNEYLSDYCFTGSYWNDPREIMEMLNPDDINYKFNLYGKNWEKVDKFKNYYKGFINYSEMPKIYASTRIVIDDANRATKDFGAVNSRVFDALASGALVITNGKIGAEEIFLGDLPVFSSEEELNELINYYLANEKERIIKIQQLQKLVLKNHTYLNRAQKVKEIICKNNLAIN